MTESPWCRREMKVAVCLKRIPAPDGNIRLAADAQGFDFSLVEWILNPPDEYALEAALRLCAQEPSSRLTALSVGTRECEVLLRKALAVGADEAVRIDAGGASSHLAARLAAAELKGGRPDLVLCGGRALDDEQGLFPAALADVLGYPHVSGVCAIEKTGGANQLSGQRRSDTGKHVLRIQLPAVIACDRMAHELRVPTLKNRMAAKKRPIRTVQPDGTLQEDDLERYRTGFGQPTERQPRKVWSSSGEAEIDELLGLLRAE